VLRDLKRIHSHIVSVAYPVINAAEEPAAASETANGALVAPSTPK
jgi:phosphate:Na+ symporter